jgi:hypothetical protein
MSDVKISEARACPERCSSGMLIRPFGETD